MRSLSDIILIDPEIQHGKPVFKNTRVPVQSLFWHLEQGISLNDFLEDFPGVKKEYAEIVLEWAANQFNNQDWKKINEAVA